MLRLIRLIESLENGTAYLRLCNDRVHLEYQGTHSRIILCSNYTSPVWQLPNRSPVWCPRSRVRNLRNVSAAVACRTFLGLQSQHTKLFSTNSPSENVSETSINR